MHRRSFLPAFIGLLLLSYGVSSRGLVSAAPPVAAPASPIELIEQGLEAFLEQNYDDSIRYFQKALQIDRRNETALQGLNSARQQYELALSKQRMREQQALAAARGYLGREHWIEAYDRLRMVLDKNPNHPKAKSMLGKIKKRVDKLHSKAKPQTNDWFYTKGILAYLDGDWYEAANTWENAYAFNPDMIFLVAKIDKAKKNLEEQQKTERIALYQNIAWENLRAGKYEDAVTAWFELLRLDPDNAEAEAGIQQAKDAVSKDRVRRRGQEVQELTQKAMDAYIEKDYQKSLELWNDVLEIEPGNTLAKDYIKRVRNRGSVKSYQLPSTSYSGTYSPAAMASNFNKAQNMFRDERYPEAIEAIERHLNKNPDDAKGKALLKEIEDKQKILGEKAYQAGLVVYSQGRIQDAIKQWQNALRIDPDFQKARQALIKALAEAKKR